MKQLSRESIIDDRFIELLNTFSTSLPALAVYLSETYAKSITITDLVESKFCEGMYRAYQILAWPNGHCVSRTTVQKSIDTLSKYPPELETISDFFHQIPEEGFEEWIGGFALVCDVYAEMGMGHSRHICPTSHIGE